MNHLISALSKMFHIDRKLIDAQQVRLYFWTHVAATVAVFFPPEHAFLKLAAAHFLVIGLGISVGFHRLLAHRSFFAHPYLLHALATLGTLALQGGPFRWVAAHRSHHAHTDRRGDPHTSKKGWWWSHIVWAINKGPNGFRYKSFAESLPDIGRNQFLNFLNVYQLHLTFALFFLCWIVLSFRDALWLVPLRLVVGWHVTFLINSLGHSTSLARRNEDSARNLSLLSVFTFGEGWHKNHHECPRSPKFSRSVLQIDVGYLVIVLFHRLRIARMRSGEVKS